jgi:uncharacterized repeat protein (TIGR01451 family)
MIVNKTAAMVVLEPRSYIMQKLKLLLSALVMGTLVAVAQPALAWHPVGKIIKQVQNVTAASPLADADTATAAIAAKPGDTLKYVITVSNIGAVDASGNNDMAFTVLTDTLPAGVVLANGGGSTITENIGLVKPGKSVVKEYLVKVTSTKDGDVITNKACFTGDSTVKDKPQSGCNNAVVTVKVPVVPVTPVTPKTPATPAVPATLPSTGPEAVVGSVLGLSGVAYAAVYAIRSKRK